VAGKDEPVIIYTDGGCRPNPGLGGWGAVLMHGNHRKELSGAEADTTNNRMELTAAVAALEALKRNCRVVLHTDSEYLQKGVTEWMPAWKRNGWKRKVGAVKNLDLWQKLDRLVQEHEVKWHWVKGHAGNLYNERCDELATEAMARLAASKPAVARRTGTCEE
jgi:ribonuclease HI